MHCASGAFPPADLSPNALSLMCPSGNTAHFDDALGSDRSNLDFGFRLSGGKEILQQGGSLG